MDFRNPPAGSERSYNVKFVSVEALDKTFVRHLFAALHREGISVFNSHSSSRDDEDITVEVGSYIDPPDPWRLHTHGFPMFITVDHHWSDNVSTWIRVVGRDSFYGFYSDWSGNMWLEDGILEVERITSTEILTDSELVEEVVKDVYGSVYRAERVNIYSKLLEIESLLYKQPRGIRSIGIWGMAGIGKTTLVKAVFKHMSTDYDASCFIENFDESFRKEGLHRLLEKSIGKILEQEFGINSSYIIRPSLHREKLCDKMILLVLDDVRDSLAAQSFLGWLDWFGPGSVIIITSVDKKVFVFCQTKQIYETQGLNDHEALQLFSQNAFGKDVPEQNYIQLSKKVVDYATGNPLALSIFGQELKGKKSEMEDVFLRLKHFPPKKIHDVLKNVYNALDVNEKNIILDIAFFFRGKNIDYVVQMLDGCRYLPRVGIDLLVDKCVLTISENTVQMNNLIQDTCKKIFIVEIETCTRMWEPYIIRCFLEDENLKASGESSATPTCDLVVEDIESIFLDTANLKFDVKHDAFKNMLNLKFLKIYNSCSKYDYGLNFPKGLVSLPCGLRLLHWENYPMQSLPQKFDLDNLVELSMPYSQLQTLGTRTENIKKLKRIRLCHSPMLVEFDRLLDAQNIELVDFQGCTRIQSFPDMSGLQHLRVVNLTGCTEIKSFQGVPPNIEELHLQGTSMREIPISTESYSPQRVKLDRQKLLNLLEKFQNVEHIDLESVTNLVKVGSSFGKLVHLNMKECFHLRSLPDMINLESLQVLHLSGCSELEEIKGFPRNMRKLYIGGTALIEVPRLPKSLEFLNAHGCKYLKSARLDFEQLPKHYIFSNCISFSLQLTPAFLAGFAGAKQQDLIKAPEVSICLPLGAHQKLHFLLELHPNAIFNLGPWTGKPICGFSMSVVVSFKNDYHNGLGLKVRCICTWRNENGYRGRMERLFQCWAPGEARKVEWDHIFIFYDTQMHPRMSDNNVKFEFHTVNWENEFLGDNCRVSQCGVQIITAPTHDTRPCEITREVEATGFIEEHPSTSPRMLDQAKSPNRSEPHKVYSAHNKLRSKGTMLWKWVKTIRRDKKKKTLTDRKPLVLTPEPFSSQ